MKQSVEITCLCLLFWSAVIIITDQLEKVFIITTE